MLRHSHHFTFSALPLSSLLSHHPRQKWLTGYIRTFDRWNREIFWSINHHLKSQLEFEFPFFQPVFELWSKKVPKNLILKWFKCGFNNKFAKIHIIFLLFTKSKFLGNAVYCGAKALGQNLLKMRTFIADCAHVYIFILQL